VRKFAISKDGTRIPLNILRPKGIKLDHNNPVLITAYGGYGISRVPTFSPINDVWLSQGGVFAVANIRGGGEFGEEWHQAGMLTKKQNCFDDFAAAMQFMIDAGYTTPEKLAITGANDARVDPMHSRKFAARLQAATASDSPIILRTSATTGHGGGTPLAILIEEYVDRYAFLFHELGLEYKAKAMLKN
jgi:prolyl oligopeptidase PreP (S9A serine peptidase family)